jgi:hypothetical protein
MEFDWVLLFTIAIVGPIFGGKMCAVLEEKITGKVRHSNEFKIKSMKSNLISIALGYIVTVMIVNLICEKTNYDLGLIIRAFSIAIGMGIYLFFHRIIYRVLLKNYQDSAT